jgi:hypothetical protein
MEPLTQSPTHVPLLPAGLAQDPLSSTKPSLTTVPSLACLSSPYPGDEEQAYLGNLWGTLFNAGLPHLCPRSSSTV